MSAAVHPTDHTTAPAIKAWFYPGSLYGHQFVYPEERDPAIAGFTTPSRFALLPAIGNFAGGLLAQAVPVSRHHLSLALHAATGLLLAVVAVELAPHANNRAGVGRRRDVRTQRRRVRHA